MKRKGVWYDENKDIIMEKYHNNERIEDIAIELQCSRYMLYQKFNEWNISRRNKIKAKPRSNAIYTINYEYFKKIDTEHKAYWYGFLLADGYVNERELSLCVKNTDIDIIQIFAEDIETDVPIKYDKYGNPFITIVCKELSKSLLDKGFHNRKSWSIDFDYIKSFVPDELFNHFIMGMFDGDGCLKYYSYPYLKKPQLHFGYTGVKNVCEFIKDFFDINRDLIFEGNVTYTVVSRDPNKIIEICTYLYNNSTIYLKRKYEIYNKIKMMTFNDYNKAVS